MRFHNIVEYITEEKPEVLPIYRNFSYYSLHFTVFSESPAVFINASNFNSSFALYQLKGEDIELHYTGDEEPLAGQKNSYNIPLHEVSDDI